MGGYSSNARVETGHGKSDTAALAGGGESEAGTIDGLMSAEEIDGADEVRVSELIVVALGFLNALEEIAGTAEEDLEDGIAALALVEHDALLPAAVSGGSDDGGEFAGSGATANRKREQRGDAGAIQALEGDTVVLIRKRLAGVLNLGLDGFAGKARESGLPEIGDVGQGRQSVPPMK